ncbi:MAG: NHL repeat-containing protein [Candidatus Eisenbacteria bacterium]|nr:NHL repeat-containing protein [Candidatus Eisenbacteria bacterium]
MKCSCFVSLLAIVLSGCLPSTGRSPFLSTARESGKVPQGTSFLFDLGSMSGEVRIFESPQAVDVDPAGNLLVVDGRGRRVEKFDRKGNYIGELASGSVFFSPKDVFSSGELGIYVLGSREGIIELYDMRGRFSKDISPALSSEGRPYSFERIALDSSGRIYLTDRAGGRVLLLTTTGEVVKSFYPSDLSSEFHPSGLAVGKDGAVFASDPVSGLIIVFDAMGGTIQSWKTGEGSSNISGIAVDGYGNLFVADCGSDKVLVYSREGRPVLSIGTRGSGPGSFRCPIDVAVSSDGMLYVADKGNDRIQAFRVDYEPSQK